MSFSLDEYLGSFWDWEKKLSGLRSDHLGLDRVERLLEAFGRPDDRLKFVHVAGSKGKGSTCAFLSAILRAAGYRVGLFTSPHLHDLRERIRILEPDEPAAIRSQRMVSQAPVHKDRRADMIFTGMITSEDLLERVLYYQPVVDQLREQGIPITYFEYLTALALSYFSAREVDVVVLETGLGGRLDATNAVDTMVCGITPIGLEHTRILGDTLSKIAFEKAGIIKAPTQRVTVAPQPEEAVEIISARCREFAIVPTVLGENMIWKVLSSGIGGVDFEVTGRRNYRGLTSRLAGEHQAVNAALAIGMAEDLELFGYVLSEEAVVRGVNEAVWPARFEVFSGAPLVILDCAHTRESAAAFRTTFQALFPGRKACLVFGASSDKDLVAITRELVPVIDRVVLARADNPRAACLEVEDGHKLFGEVPVYNPGSVSAALEEACRLAGPEGLVAVVGSVFLCAQARMILLDPRIGRGHVSV